MDSPKPGLDLEKELTCSICTELLYQPLTLLDCLHTFCGACLKEWFSFQAATAQRSPTPPTPQTVVFTCPSCRASVRDTRHNATVVTLLDMFVAANPEKARAEADKEEMAGKYTPGDQVLPKIQYRERTAAERRAEEEDERLIQEVRDASLREARGELSVPPRTRRHRESRSAGDRPRSSREHSSSSAHRTSRDAPRRSTDLSRGEGERRRRRRSDSSHRHVEHQSSIRSLISSADMNERDIEKEIEDFAKQIQEEGLLDGLDLDNIDLTRDDELSRRITEAYRRRQRDRPRQESEARRNHAASHSSATRQSESPQAADSRHLAPERSSREGSRPRTSSRSTSATSQTEDRSRPPTSASATANLEAPNPTRRPRRRTASGGRSATTPLFSSAPEPRPAARSQTDLPLRASQDPEVVTSRPTVGETRSSSTPTVPSTGPPAQVELPGDAPRTNTSFADRMPREHVNPPQSPKIASELEARRSAASNRPPELTLSPSAPSNPGTNTTPTSNHRSRSQLYPEPSITCSSCKKPHIEYDVHYNCAICFAGQWNICLNCYRTGKGCSHWFGFGHAAKAQWERRRKDTGDIPPPHILKPRRYLPPPSTPGGADGRKTLTRDDPANRLQTGTFCAKCLAWTNDCHWRCEYCNDGEWGFCNDCVNQGRSCSHMLLPVSLDVTHSPNRPSTPRSPARPPSATVSRSQDPDLGSFQALTFNTRCDICQDVILPARTRYHCYECTSTLVSGASPGDYDICVSCYAGLVQSGRISEENGFAGWRRCLNGHRMAVIGFAESRQGPWRYVERDLVGGHVLSSEPFNNPDNREQVLLKWSWKLGDQRWERLVSKAVASSAPRTAGTTTFTDSFPPDGGVGRKATAKWGWYPQDGDGQDLMFPRGADIGEVDSLNDEWLCGTYMGADGAFPAAYVLVKEDS